MGAKITINKKKVAEQDIPSAEFTVPKGDAEAPAELTPHEESSLRIEQIAWFDDRYYKVYLEDGSERFLPSVTTILNIVPNFQIWKWRAEVGNEEADRRMHEAAARGSRIHAATSILEAGGAVIFNDERKPVYSRKEIMELEQQYPSIIVLGNQNEMNQVVKYRRFLDVVKPKLVRNEEMVASVEHGFAGTLDRIYEIEEGNYLISGKQPVHLQGGLYILDIKSSSSIDENYYLQIAAYAKICGFPIIGGLIAHTNASTRTGIEGFTVHVRTLDEIDQDFETFLTAFKLWKWKNPSGAPKIFTFPSLLAMNIELEA